MYTDKDIEDAVASGRMTQASADGLRGVNTPMNSSPDDESFRLLTGFNDIFVTVALVLTLSALAWIAAVPGPVWGAGALVAASWFLGEQFIRRRRMALPALALLAAFTGAAGVFCWLAYANLVLSSAAHGHALSSGVQAGAMLCGWAGAAAAAYGHWCRFKVPAAVAATMLALVFGLLMAVAIFVAPAALIHHVPQVILAAGALLFATGLWWDMKDPDRRTRQSDVAFWLHLAAAPMLVHPMFGMLGLDPRVGFLHQAPGLLQGVLALLVYLLLGVVALVTDRRAVLVSGLFYVIYSLSILLATAGMSTLTLPVTGLFIGAALLCMSAWWRQLRSPLVRRLPARVRRVLPPVPGAPSGLQPAP